MSTCSPIRTVLTTLGRSKPFCLINGIWTTNYECPVYFNWKYGSILHVHLCPRRFCCVRSSFCCNFIFKHPYSSALCCPRSNGPIGSSVKFVWYGLISTLDLRRLIVSRPKPFHWHGQVGEKSPISHMESASFGKAQPYYGTADVWREACHDR